MNILKAIIAPVFIPVTLSLGLAAMSLGEDARPAAASPAAPNHSFMEQLNEGFAGIFDKIAPSVVIIDATKKESADDDSEMDGLEFFFRNPQGKNDPRFKLPPQARKSEGSGFVVRPDGYIFTNNHVIEGAEKIDVKLKDGRRFVAKLVGADETSDIAVLKIDATGLPAVEFADSDAVKVGQMICSIGIPFNLDYSFACGWVSGKGRTGLTRTTYEDYLQTDSFVNPGDSGGPVLDIDGRVIGMNTLINGIGRKLTFAIPSNMLKEIGDQLIATGKVVHSWLGIGIYTLGEETSFGELIKGIDHGVVVSRIAENAPAFKSDLRVSDVITQVDGKEVATAHELQKEIVKKKAGAKVDLTVWRDGKTIQVAVVTGEMPDMTNVSNVAPAVPKNSGPDAGKEDAEKDGGYGFNVQDLSSDLAQKLKLKGAKGAVVTDVADGSPASAAGIQKDDLITGVDSQEVKDSAAFKALIDKHDPAKPVLLFINRKGQKTYAILKTDS